MYTAGSWLSGSIVANERIHVFVSTLFHPAEPFDYRGQTSLVTAAECFSYLVYIIGIEFETLAF